MRTSARPRRASSAECGLSHQRSRPMTGRRPEGGPVERAPQAGGPGHRLGAHRGPAGRRQPGDPAVELRGATGCPRAPSGPTRPAGPARASTGERAPPATSRRTAARPRARRAVRADQAKGVWPAPVGRLAAERDPDLVVGDPERARRRRAGRPGRRASPWRRRARRATRTASTAGDRGHQHVGQAVSHRRRASRVSHAASGRRWPGGAPRARPRRRSGRWPIRAAPGGTGVSRCAGSRAAREVQRPPLAAPRARRSTARARTARRCRGCGRPTRRSKIPCSTTRPPASGMATRSSVRGIQPGANRGTRSAQVRRRASATVSARAARAAAGSDSTWRTTPSSPPARSASSASASGSPIVSRVHELAEQRVHETRQDQLVGEVPVARRAAPSGDPSSWRGPRKSAGACVAPGGHHARRRRPRARPAGRRPGRGRSAAAPRCRRAAARARLSRCLDAAGRAPAGRAGAAGVVRRGPSAQCAPGCDTSSSTLASAWHSPCVPPAPATDAAFFVIFGDLRRRHGRADRHRDRVGGAPRHRRDGRRGGNAKRPEAQRPPPPPRADTVSDAARRRRSGARPPGPNALRDALGAAAARRRTDGTARRRGGRPSCWPAAAAAARSRWACSRSSSGAASGPTASSAPRSAPSTVRPTPATRRSRGSSAWPTIWRDVKGTDIFPRGTFDGPWAFLQKRAAVHANTGLRAIIEAGIDYENLEDASHPGRGGDDVAHRRAGALDHPRARRRGHPGLLGHPVHLPAGDDRRRRARRRRRRQQRADQPRPRRPGATASTCCCAGRCTTTRPRRAARPRRR